MKAERGPSSAGIATMSRGISPSVSRETSPSRHTFSQLSVNRGVDTSRPGIRLGGLRPFVPRPMGIINEGPVRAFNIKNTKEFSINPGIYATESRIPVRRVTRHRKVNAISSNAFRPREFSNNEIKANPPIESKTLEISNFEPPTTPNETSKSINSDIGIGILSAKIRKLSAIGTSSSTSDIRNDEVRIPRGNEEISIKRLEEVVAKKRYALGIKNPRVGYVSNIPRFLRAPKEDEEEWAKKIIEIPVIQPLRQNTLITEPKLKQSDLNTSKINPVLMDKVIPTDQIIPEIKKNPISSDAKPEQQAIFNPKTNIKNKPYKQEELEEKEKPEVDTSANSARLEEILKAKNAIEQKAKMVGRTPTWREVADSLPNDPTEPMISAIVKHRKVNGRKSDGSYSEVREVLAKMGDIYPKHKPDALLRALPAVRMGKRVTNPVTKKDVERVIGNTDLDIQA